MRASVSRTELRGELVALIDEAERIAGPLSAAQALWRPEAGRWSVADCIEHLNETARRYIERVDGGLTLARRKRRHDGPVHFGFLFKRAIASMEPPPQHRLPAPDAFVPEAPQWPEALEDHRALLEAVIVRLDTAISSELDLNAVRVASPVTSLLRMRLGTAFAFLAAHARRHLWQAERVTRSEGFPDD